MTRSRQPRTIEELLDKVVVCPSGCWLWAGGDSGAHGRGAGYGRILRPGTRKVMPAHRYVHEVFIGPIPPGWHVDHICRAWSWHPIAGRRCVNPAHLEAVPVRLNMARRDHAAAMTQELVLPDEPLPAHPVAAPLLAPGETLDDMLEGFV